MWYDRKVVMSEERDMPSIFICYSHQDKGWRDRLLKFLQPLNDEEKIVWSDLDIQPGDIWDEKIKDSLSQVTIAMVLVSQDLLNSRYVKNEELPRLLQRREQEGVVIIPIFVRHCTVKSVSFKYTNEEGIEQRFYLDQFQSPNNNSPSNPLCDLTRSAYEKVFVSLAETLRSLIEESKKKQSNESQKIIVKTEKNEQTRDFPEMGESMGKPTEGFACYSDPEYAVNCSKTETFDSFQMTLKCQFKVHLLMNVHILIPGGYFFDNPAIWDLLYYSEDFRNLLLSKPDTQSKKTTLIISKPQGSNLDSVFRTWFVGEDGQRFNNPSSLRTNWMNNISSDDIYKKLSSLRQKWESLTIHEYADELSLDLLKSDTEFLDYLFNNSSSRKTPPNRHSRFFRGVKSILNQDFEFDGKQQLLVLLDQIENSGKDRISRSEIQKYAPKAWDSIKSELIFLRQSCYFDNDGGYGSISVLPNFGIRTSKTIIGKLLKKVEESLRSSSPYRVAFDELTFAQVLNMRSHKGLMESIKKLYTTQNLNFKEPERTDRLLDILLYEWSENLLDAASKVEKTKKSGQLVVPKEPDTNSIHFILAAASTILPVEINPSPFVLKSDRLSAILCCCAHLLSGVLPQNPDVSAKLLVRTVKSVKSTITSNITT